jgi:hypothetical protein
MMSRHIIPGRDPKHQVVVGWDRPCAGFFGQVIVPGETDDDEDDVVFWVGAGYPGQVPTVEDLALHLRPYAEIDGETRAVLLADQKSRVMS